MTATKPEAPTLDAEYPTLALLASGKSTVGYQKHGLEQEAIHCYQRLRAIVNAKGMPEYPKVFGAGCAISKEDYDALRLHAQHLQDRLNRMESLLREPSEEMQTAGVDATEFTFSCKRQIRNAFVAMSAALLAKLEKEK